MRSCFIGSLFSIIGQCTSGFGMNLQRYAHLIEKDKPLYKKWPFLLALLCIVLTEVFNFIALSFAPVSSIAPLGSINILASAFFGQYFFSENVKPKGVVGIVLISIGTVLTVINSQSESKEYTVEEFTALIKSPTTIAYYSVLLTIMIVIQLLCTENLYGLVIFAAISAGNSVTLVKALAVFVKISITQKNQLANLLPYLILVFVICCGILQVSKLNKAMESNKAYVVNSLYFVMFTIISISNSSFLYGELASMRFLQQFLFIVGCAVIMLGVYMLSYENSDAEKKENKSDSEKVPFLNNRKRSISNDELPL